MGDNVFFSASECNTRAGPSFLCVGGYALYAIGVLSWLSIVSNARSVDASFSFVRERCFEIAESIEIP